MLRIQPELFELAREGYERKEVGTMIREGICEECERFDLLYNKEGKLVCNQCN